jgi:hypothetical protein
MASISKPERATIAKATRIHLNLNKRRPTMSIQLKEESGGNILTIHVNGTLTKEDYGHFVPEFDRLIKQHGKLRLLFDMQDFHGWEASALWEDLKFGVRHFTDIEQMAMIGENKWQHGMAIFAKPFTTAKVRYFEQAQLAEALAWIGLDVPIVA